MAGKKLRSSNIDNIPPRSILPWMADAKSNVANLGSESGSPIDVQKIANCKIISYTTQNLHSLMFDHAISDHLPLELLMDTLD